MFLTRPLSQFIRRHSKVPAHHSAYILTVKRGDEVSAKRDVLFLLKDQGLTPLRY